MAIYIPQCLKTDVKKYNTKYPQSENLRTYTKLQNDMLYSVCTLLKFC